MAAGCKRRGAATQNVGALCPTEEPRGSQQADIGHVASAPGYGPSQIRNMLKRGGFKVSVGTVRHVMEAKWLSAPDIKAQRACGPL